MSRQLSSLGCCVLPLLLGLLVSPLPQLHAQPLLAEDSLAITATDSSSSSANLTSVAQSLNVSSGLLASAPTTLGTTAGLGARPNTSRSAVLRGAGSSAMQPLLVAALEMAGGQGRAQAQDFDISYDALGTGTGQSMFLSSSPDAAYLIEDVPLNSTTLARSNRTVVQVPIAINAVGIYANLPGRSNTSSSVNTSTSISTSPLRLDGCTLARIFSGQISSWDEPAIRELNPGVSLPSEHIRVFARGDGSGTTVLLTCYLRKACPQQWSQERANRLDWPAGVNVVNSTAAMISAINSTQYALGYAPAPAPLPGQLAIENAAGRFVASQLGQGAGSALLSANLSELGTQYPAFDADEQNRLWADLSNALIWGSPSSPATAYPLTSITFIAAPQDTAALGPAGPLLKEFVGFLIRGSMQAELQRKALVFQRLPGGLAALAHAVHDTMGVQPGRRTFSLPARRRRGLLGTGRRLAGAAGQGGRW